LEIMRLGQQGQERPAARLGEDLFDLSPLTRDVDGQWFAEGGIAAAREALQRGTLPLLEDADKLRVGSPVVRPPAVLCIGQNYAAHAAETGAPPPPHPIVFLKHPNTVVGPYDTVPLPEDCDTLDWEVELAVVIGRRTHRLTGRSDVADAIAGYTVANDVSDRHRQIELSGGQWAKGKIGPGFCPVGPSLLPADEIDPADLRIQSWVNGEPRQDSTTSDMIFDVAALVLDLSQYVVLEAGDLVLTGTPQGVALSGNFPYLAAGDVIETKIERLGHQRQVIGDPITTTPAPARATP
jgi:2,4-diketo-3-deoxy-L-fuconate hydrolase